MSITYSTSNERSMIFGKGVDAHSLFDADKCGKAVAMSIALKLGTSGQ